MSTSDEDPEIDHTSAEPDPDNIVWDVSEDELAAAEVHPVSTERVRTWLKQAGNHYFVRPDGQPAGIWNGSLFSFTVTPQVLQVRGQWHRTITIERRAEFMALINAMHTRTAWPKCLLQVMDDGSMRLSSEVDTPIRTGLSDQQLSRALRLGIGVSLALFVRLGKQFPDPLMSAGAA